MQGPWEPKAEIPISNFPTILSSWRKSVSNWELKNEKRQNCECLKQIQQQVQRSRCKGESAPVNRKMSLLGLSCRAVQQLWHICSRSCLDFSVRQNELKTESRGQTWDLVYHKGFLGYGSWPWEQMQRLSQSPPLTRLETTHWMEFTQATVRGNIWSLQPGKEKKNSSSVESSIVRRESE